MASQVTPKKNAAFRFWVSLVSQANTKVFQGSATLAAGDVKVSTDGGALANLATLPTVTPAAGKLIQVDLSSAEMNGDNVTVIFSDAAGAEWCDLTVNIQTTARQIDDLAYPATTGRSMVVDAAGLVDANAVKLGPTGAGTAQTARDIGASVLLSAGIGTGQLDFTSGVVKANATQWLGGTIPAVNVTGVPLVDAKYLLGTIFPTPTVAGVPNVNVKTWNDLTTVALPLVPTVAGRTLDVSVGGEAGLDWANVGTPGSTNNLSATTVNLVNTLTTYTGNTVQTGDAFARIGLAGVGLTNLGDTRIANLDAAVSTRSTYAGGDTSGTTTLLTRIGATITITGGKVDVNDKTGFSLLATGLDLVLVAGKTLPNALKYIGATTAGVISGAGTATETFQDFAGVTAVTVTADASGNRSAVIYN